MKVKTAEIKISATGMNAESIIKLVIAPLSINADIKIVEFNGKT